MIISLFKSTLSFFSKKGNVPPQSYDGYTPSHVRPQRKLRTFDEAIQAAPIRDEWIDENHWGYVWHITSRITGREWFEGVAFVTLLFLIMLFVLSR